LVRLENAGGVVLFVLLGVLMWYKNLSAVLLRRATLTGSTLRPRTVEEKGAIARDLELHVWPLLGTGTVKPLVHSVFPLERAADAHRALESGAVIGKVVLTT
jgi:NADPH2:quinone reductase